MFRFQKDHRKWFKNIRSELNYDFDAFYMCFVAGVAANKKIDYDNSSDSDLIDYFPGEYTKTSKLIISLFLVAESLSLGINISKKNEAIQHLNTFIDPDTQSRLSRDGYKSFNQYAAGGYEVITNELQQPFKLGIFLTFYHDMIDKKFSENKLFNSLNN